MAGLSATAAAQRAITVVVEPLPCAEGRNALTLILNGDERDPVILHLIDGVWSGPAKDKRKTPFPSVPAIASLRLNGARTYCRQSQHPEKGNLGQDIAVFHFDCNEDRVQTVTINPGPSVPFSYVRWLTRSPAPRPDGLDCACLESSTAPGRKTIPDVLFPVEQLLLQIGNTTPNDLGRGLFVNDPDVIPNALKGGSARLNKKKVIAILQRQRVNRAYQTRPDFVPLSTDVDMDTIPKDLDLQVTVRK